MEGHHWRYCYGSAFTVVGTEMVSLDSLILNLSPLAVVKKRNKNPHDYTRTNLSLSRQTSRQPSRIEVNGDVAYLILRDAQTVILDAEDVSRVEMYSWSTNIVRGIPHIVTVTNEGRKMRLPRLILSIHPKNNASLVHINGDPFDCRKSNLQFSGSRLVIEEQQEVTQ